MDPKATLEQLLSHLGFTVTVAARDVEDQILLDIQTEDPGRLIGRAGQTLGDLQFVVNRLGV